MNNDVVFKLVQDLRKLTHSPNLTQDELEVIYRAIKELT